MRAAKVVTPAQLDQLKFAFACLLSRTQGKGFTKDEQDGIIEAWEIVRDPQNDEPLIATCEDRTPDPNPPVKTLIELVTGKWSAGSKRQDAGI